MKLFYEIKDSVFDASGIITPEEWFWEEINGVYYPEQMITEEEYHNLVYKFIVDENLPIASLDEIEWEAFDERQFKIRGFFMDLFDTITNREYFKKKSLEEVMSQMDMNKPRQIDYMRLLWHIGINVVVCNTCPSTFFHQTGAGHITCPYCLTDGKPEDFSDLVHE